MEYEVEKNLEIEYIENNQSKNETEVEKNLEFCGFDSEHPKVDDLKQLILKNAFHTTPRNLILDWLSYYENNKKFSSLDGTY